MNLNFPSVRSVKWKSETYDYEMIYIDTSSFRYFKVSFQSNRRNPS